MHQQAFINQIRWHGGIAMHHSPAHKLAPVSECNHSCAGGHVAQTFVLSLARASIYGGVLRNHIAMQQTTRSCFLIILSFTLSILLFITNLLYCFFFCLSLVSVPDSLTDSLEK